MHVFNCCLDSYPNCWTVLIPAWTSCSSDTLHGSCVINKSSDRAFPALGPWPRRLEVGVTEIPLKTEDFYSRSESN